MNMKMRNTFLKVFSNNLSVFFQSIKMNNSMGNITSLSESFL